MLFDISLGFDQLFSIACKGKGVYFLISVAKIERGQKITNNIRVFQGLLADIVGPTQQVSKSNCKKTLFLNKST